jgi:hypothetical protein
MGKLMRNKKFFVEKKFELIIKNSCLICRTDFIFSKDNVHSKVYVVSLVLSLVFKTVIEVYLALLAWKSVFKEYSDAKL